MSRRPGDGNCPPSGQWHHPSGTGVSPEKEIDMLFSSLTFLYYFLPAVLIVYFLVPDRGKNLVLLLASLLF